MKGLIFVAVFFLDVTVHAGLTERNVRQALAGVRCDEVALYEYTRECKREVVYGRPVVAGLPLRLFLEFEPLKDFFRAECATGIRITVKHVPSKQVYTLWLTDDDVCDGGNVYGAMVRGVSPAKKNVVRLVQDSDLGGLNDW